MRPPGTLYVLSAPSGAGKTSLVRALIASDPQVQVSVSHTTRMRRPGERDGVHYHFVDAERFEEMLQADTFLEHARVFGHRYGTSRRWVEARLAQGMDVILEIDWQGARQVRTKMPDSVSVFVLPPSRAELERRLERRGEDPPEVVAQRMQQARHEMSHWDEFDYVVVNDRFEPAVADLRALIRAERLRAPAQQLRWRALLHALLEEGTT